MRAAAHPLRALISVITAGMAAESLATDTGGSRAEAAASYKKCKKKLKPKGHRFQIVRRKMSCGAALRKTRRVLKTPPGAARVALLASQSPTHRVVLEGKARIRVPPDRVSRDRCLRRFGSWSAPGPARSAD